VSCGSVAPRRMERGSSAATSRRMATLRARRAATRYTRRLQNLETQDGLLTQSATIAIAARLTWAYGLRARCVATTVAAILGTSFRAASLIQASVNESTQSV
jgi:hypothetical protein